MLKIHRKVCDRAQVGPAGRGWAPGPPPAAPPPSPPGRPRASTRSGPRLPHPLGLPLRGAKRPPAPRGAVEATSAELAPQEPSWTPRCPAQPTWNHGCDEKPVPAWCWVWPPSASHCAVTPSFALGMGALRASPPRWDPLAHWARPCAELPKPAPANPGRGSTPLARSPGFVCSLSKCPKQNITFRLQRKERTHGQHPCSHVPARSLLFTQLRGIDPARPPVSVLQYQTRAAPATPAALQIRRAKGAQYCDTERLRLSLFSAKIRNKQHLTASGLVFYPKAVAD